MNFYYCPYCSPLYQFHKQTSDGVMICGQCGDPLEKKPFVKPVKIFAFIAAIAFIAPFFLLVFISLENLNRQKPKVINAPMAMITEQELVRN